MTGESNITARGGCRISLRAVNKKDFAVLGKLRNDRVVQESLLTVARPNSPARVRAWLKRRAADDAGAFFVIASVTNDQAIGFIQASGIDSLNRIAEMGICLDMAGRGQGYGREAIGLLEKYLVQVFNIRKIWLHVAANNAPAIALYLSSGFREVGTLKKHRFVNGQFRDVVVMEKLLSKSKLPRR
jgi:RimJ/RimL family protein N-acetyltransferase